MAEVRVRGPNNKVFRVGLAVNASEMLGRA